jgi:hypothetical protein
LSRDHHRETEAHGQHKVGGDGHDQSGGQRGVAPHDAGSQQLLPAELLGLPGVPDDGQHTHHSGQHRQRQRVAVQGVTPDAGTRDQAEHPHAGVLYHNLRIRPQQFGMLGVAVLEQAGRRSQECRHAEDPGWQDQPVSPQREADQTDGAGETAHRAVTASTVASWPVPETSSP